MTGNQGVLIPKSNITHLMLRRDVIESVKKGKFHIYPVVHIDEGIEILTGIKSGEKQADGSYPANSFNAIENQWKPQ